MKINKRKSQVNTYTTISQEFDKNYPVEFSGLDHEQKREAMEEFDHVGQIEADIKDSLSNEEKSSGVGAYAK